MKIKNIVLCILIMSLAFVSCACSSGGEDETVETNAVENIVPASDGEVEHTQVRFDVADVGSFTVATYPEYAPRTVARFLELVKMGYFDGASVEFLEPGKIMKLSDNTALSSGEFKDTLIGEFSKNGYSNNLSITKGTLVFDYLPGEYDSATSKIMFVLSDDADMDGSYAGFAKVKDDSGVFGLISSEKVDSDNKPLSPIVMKKVYIKE